MTREEKQKAIEYFKWWKSFNEHTQKAIPKDTIAYKAYQTEIGFYDMAIKALEQESVIDKITELIEPLRHLSIDQMSDIEWLMLRMIDKYRAESEDKK